MNKLREIFLAMIGLLEIQLICCGTEEPELSEIREGLYPSTMVYLKGNNNEQPEYSWRHHNSPDEETNAFNTQQDPFADNEAEKRGFGEKEAKITSYKQVNKSISY